MRALTHEIWLNDKGIPEKFVVGRKHSRFSGSRMHTKFLFASV